MVFGDVAGQYRGQVGGIAGGYQKIVVSPGPNGEVPFTVEKGEVIVRRIGILRYWL